jgi:hypothetical protein
VQLCADEQDNPNFMGLLEFKALVEGSLPLLNHRLAIQKSFTRSYDLSSSFIV